MHFFQVSVNNWSTFGLGKLLTLLETVGSDLAPTRDERVKGCADNNTLFHIPHPRRWQLESSGQRSQARTPAGIEELEQNCKLLLAMCEWKCLFMTCVHSILHYGWKNPASNLDYLDMTVHPHQGRRCPWWESPAVHKTRGCHKVAILWGGWGKGHFRMWKWPFSHSRFGHFQCPKRKYKTTSQ